MASDPEFRLAVPADWGAIWRIMREVIASGDTYMFAPSMDESAAREAWLFDGSDRRSTLCACCDDEIVGTAILKPNAAGPGDHVANAAWMVSSAARGRGVGRAFAEHVIEYARMIGFMDMQFNAVVSTNVGAIRLWESLGFKTVGTVPGAFRHPSCGLVAIHIMHRRL
ncbi:MAG: GNAT family N-acetyltransferase [Planctomycetota bacterium]